MRVKTFKVGKQVARAATLSVILALTLAASALPMQIAESATTTTSAPAPLPACRETLVTNDQGALIILEGFPTPVIDVFGNGQLTCIYGPVEIILHWSSDPGACTPSSDAGSNKAGSSGRFESPTRAAWVTYETSYGQDEKYALDNVARIALGLVETAEALSAHCGEAAETVTTEPGSASTTTAPNPNAFACFPGAPQDASHPNIALPEILADLRMALSNHDATHAPEKAARGSDESTYGGALGVIRWLYGDPGTASSDMITAYVTGDEDRLTPGLAALSKRRKDQGAPYLLTPGDVLQQALNLSEGSTERALLSIHNTFRALEYGDSQGHLGVKPDHEFFKAHLADLGGESSADSWIGMFASAYLVTATGGDGGAWLGAGAGGSMARSGLAPLSAEFVATAGDFARSSASNDDDFLGAITRSWQGRPASKEAADDVALCISTWGAELGAVLEDELPTHLTGVDAELTSGFQAAKSVQEISAPGTLGDSPFVSVSGAGFSVQWTYGSEAMVLDQGNAAATASLSGGMAGLVVPFESDGKWGAAWISPQDHTPTITLSSPSKGARLNFVRTNVLTGESATYEATAREASEKFEITLDGETLAPKMTRSNGSEIRPSLSSIDLTRQVTSDSASPLADPEIYWPNVLAIVGVLLLAALMMALVRRRQGSPRD